MEDGGDVKVISFEILFTVFKLLSVGIIEEVSKELIKTPFL